MPPNSPANSVPECRRFFELFVQHWTQGTGLERHDPRAKARDTGWTDRTFADAMGKSGSSKADADTMKSWRNGEQWPQKGRKDAILKVFFGPPKAEAKESETERLRTEMNLAWEDGQAVRKRPQTPIGPSSPAAAGPGWQPDAPWYLREDFARLDVEPQPSGARSDRFTLAVSLRLDQIYMKIAAGEASPRLAVTVRATMVEIMPYEENVQPVPGTILGRDRKFTNVTHGVGWRIANPVGQNDNPLAGSALCDMRLRGDGPHGVLLTLRCRDVDLGVEIHDPPAGVTAKDLAVLRRVLQRMDCGDPDAEYIELARGGLHRGPCR